MKSLSVAAPLFVTSTQFDTPGNKIVSNVTFYQHDLSPQQFSVSRGVTNPDTHNSGRSGNRADTLITCIWSTVCPDLLLSHSLFALALTTGLALSPTHRSLMTWRTEMNCRADIFVTSATHSPLTCFLFTMIHTVSWFRD